MSKGESLNIFSYSQLSTFQTCPQQYKIIYLDGVRKNNESIEAFMGKRVHEVLEWLYSTENRSRPYISFDKLCLYQFLIYKFWHFYKTINIYINKYSLICNSC